MFFEKNLSALKCDIGNFQRESSSKLTYIQNQSLSKER